MNAGSRWASRRRHSPRLLGAYPPNRTGRGIPAGGQRRLKVTGASPVRWRRNATTTNSFHLPVLALLIGVHVKTLRAAARDGRLPVTYDTRTTFRHLRARATPAAARAFRRSYYGRTVRPVDRRAPLTWAIVPDDYAEQIRAVRRARGLSQAQLATLVGAAHKAVVYQWEARKRCPSPVFWARIQAISNRGRL